MTNHDMARAYMEEAARTLREAETAYQPSWWHRCMRRSQEVVESATKAALRAVGVEPPKLHDTGKALRQERNRFPAWFAERIEEIAAAAEDLAGHRLPSFYGDEEAGIPPSELYDRDRATQALDATRQVHQLCARLVEELSPKP